MYSDNMRGISFQHAVAVVAVVSVLCAAVSCGGQIADGEPHIELETSTPTPPTGEDATTTTPAPDATTAVDATTRVVASGSACEAGAWDDDGNSATACAAWTSCMPGEAVATGGSSVANRTCAACASGTFTAAANAASCTPWSDCAPGSYVSALGSPAADRQCSVCPAGQRSTSTNAESCRVVPVQIVAGDYHTCARLSDGTVRCWGSNAIGQLGDGTTTQRLTPTAVPGLSDVVGLSAGHQHTCAVLSDGTARCWGSNSDGQLGDGVLIQGTGIDFPGPSRRSPTAVVGLSGSVDIACGALHTCARLNDGTLYCWGRDVAGSTWTVRPTLMVGLAGVAGLAPGSQSTFVRLSDGTVRLLGGNNPFGGLSGVVGIDAKWRQTCAVLNDGTVRCWGDNDVGQLGDGTTMWRSGPVAVLGLSSVTQIATGSAHVCARRSDATVHCWGSNSGGQLGDGTTTRQLVATPVPGLSDVVEVSAGGAGYTCARLSDGTLRCWGANYYGNLGDGTTTNRLTPTPVAW